MAAEEEEEEEESILHLFDLYWFKHQILKNPKPNFHLTYNVDKESTKPTNPSPLQLITPSIDHHSFISKDGGVESPKSVLTLSKDTQEIFSDDEPIIKKNNKKSRRRKRSSRFRKSLTELEHEELKGFMELGFVFPEEARGRVGVDEEARGEVYLSKTWNKNTSSEMKMMMVMMMKNWRLPSFSNEDDMKRHLRVWAHVVASAVT